MNLTEELQQERVTHLELSGYATATEDATVGAVLDKMRTAKRSVCLITAGERLVGILTERDIARHILELPGLLDASVSTLMTPDPVTVGPDTPAADALRLMQERHFRNLPVVDAQGRILGVMTHNAVIDYLAARYPEAVLNRPPDPERFPRKPEGG
ncbi:MAG: CBS domain-containing protein [Caldilineae bacterium]|nr:MAG: CBS domain-containing protein [Caldilineae bacterium]